MESLKNAWEFLKVSIIIFVLLILFDVLTYLFFHYGFHLWNIFDSNTEDSSMLEIHYISLTLLTIGLIAVAWVQLKGSNNNLRGEFLLEIDRRLTSDEISKAEMIIQELCWEYKVIDIKDNENIKKVSQAIVDIARNESISNGLTNSEKLIYLLNFLDFLETVAYFSTQKLLDESDIVETLGGTLAYYCNIFEDLIEHQRNYLKNEHYYFNLKKIANYKS